MTQLRGKSKEQPKVSQGLGQFLVKSIILISPAQEGKAGDLREASLNSLVELLLPPHPRSLHQVSVESGAMPANRLR